MFFVFCFLFFVFLFFVFLFFCFCIQEEFYGSNVVLMQEKTSTARGHRRAGWFNVVRGAVRQVGKRKKKMFFAFAFALLCFAVLCCAFALLCFACAQANALHGGPNDA